VLPQVSGGEDIIVDSVAGSLLEQSVLLCFAAKVFEPPTSATPGGAVWRGGPEASNEASMSEA